MEMHPIAHIRSSFPEKFGIPRQSGLAQKTEARIVFEPEYRNPDALRGLEGFSHIWLIWEFSANRKGTAAGTKGCGSAMTWQPTVRPPRLGGNASMGVFATRSPYRPNPLGLSSVRIGKIEPDSPEGPVIHVLGADLMDGTPIYDIKPYITYADSHPDAECGYVDSLPERTLEVELSSEVAELWSTLDCAAELEEVLSLDPRPSYQNDPERVYGLTFGAVNVKFKVADGVLTVLSFD